MRLFVDSQILSQTDISKQKHGQNHIEPITTKVMFQTFDMEEIEDLERLQAEENEARNDEQGE